MDLSVSEIAELVNGTVAGDGNVRVKGVNGLQEAGAGDLCFVRGQRYWPLLETSKAAAVLINEVPEWLKIPAIVVPMPDLAFAMVLKRIETQSLVHPTGIHATASVSPRATIGADVAMDAHAVVAEGARIGDRVVLYAGVYIGRNCRVGDDTAIYPNAVLREDTEVGKRCIIHAGAVLGSDGFGFAPLGGEWMKIPQVGRVVIGDDVEIGANSCVDRATFGETVIGRGSKIDNLVQVGHNVRMGEHCAAAAMAGIAGSATIGNHVRIGAQSGIAGHIRLEDGATVGGGSGVMQSVPAGQTVMGYPADEAAAARKAWMATRRTPEMARRLRQLERQVETLEKKLNER